MAKRIGGVFVDVTAKNAKFLAAAKKNTSAFARFGRELTNSRRRARRWNRVARTMRSRLLALGGAVASVQLIRGIVSATREMQLLETRLTAVTGSAQAAAGAMELVQRVTVKTPESLTDMTNAYIKLRQFGVDPTEKSLLSLSDLAIAQGQSLSFLTDATTAAARGLLARMDEIGISAVKVGDELVLTWEASGKEITRTVALTTSVAENHRRIIEVVMDRASGFAGAAIAQSQKLDGAISNLGIAWQAFLTRVGQAGLGESIAGLARDLTSLSDESGGLADNLGRFLSQGVEALRRELPEMKRIVTELADTLEWFNAVTNPNAWRAGMKPGAMAGLKAVLPGRQLPDASPFRPHPTFGPPAPSRAPAPSAPQTEPSVTPARELTPREQSLVDAAVSRWLTGVSASTARFERAASRRQFAGAGLGLAGRQPGGVFGGARLGMPGTEGRGIFAGAQMQRSLATVKQLEEELDKVGETGQDAFDGIGESIARSVLQMRDLGSTAEQILAILQSAAVEHFIGQLFPGGEKA